MFDVKNSTMRNNVTDALLWMLRKEKYTQKDFEKCSSLDKLVRALSREKELDLQYCFDMVAIVAGYRPDRDIKLINVQQKVWSKNASGDEGLPHYFLLPVGGFDEDTLTLDLNSGSAIGLSRMEIGTDTKLKYQRDGLVLIVLKQDVKAENDAKDNDNGNVNNNGKKSKNDDCSEEFDVLHAAKKCNCFINKFDEDGSEVYEIYTFVPVCVICGKWNCPAADVDNVRISEVVPASREDCEGWHVEIHKFCVVCLTTVLTLFVSTHLRRAASCKPCLSINEIEIMWCIVKTTVEHLSRLIFDMVPNMYW